MYEEVGIGNKPEKNRLMGCLLRKDLNTNDLQPSSNCKQQRVL